MGRPLRYRLPHTAGVRRQRHPPLGNPKYGNPQHLHQPGDGVLPGKRQEGQRIPRRLLPGLPGWGCRRNRAGPPAVPGADHRP